MQTLIELQMKNEEEALGMGVKRYKEALQRGEDTLPPGLLLVKRAVEPMSVAIQAYVDKAQSGAACRSVGVANYLSQFDAQLVAYLTAKTAFHYFAASGQLQRVALEIASRLEDTLNFDQLKEEAPKLYWQLQRKIKHSSDPNYRHVVLRKQQKFAGLVAIKWGQAEKLRLGTLLLHIMEESTGLIELTKIVRGRHDTPIMVVPSAETRGWLDKSHARCELLSPVYMPMLVTPREWHKPYGGGYLSHKLRYPLIKTGNSNYLEELKSWPMDMVYQSVNALQATPWKINRAVFDVMRAVWDGGGRLGSLPGREDEPMPGRNFDEENPDAEALRAWKQKAAGVYEVNRRLVSKRAQAVSKLWLAEKFAAAERFYFPHALDWRGRAYPVASFLNPQGDDASKALLQFADGKPLGDNGAYWLAVHGANCFGEDKVVFDDRVAWATANEAAILDSAMSPLDGQRFWTQADSPYQFLAFCMEWAGYCIEGDAYVSKLAVSWDGACNGLQNFSAMLRDEVGGEAVGLVPSDTPPDIYAEVAEVSQALIDEEAAAGSEIAQRWVGRVTRGWTKRNTMTVPYGVSQFGMKEQLMDEYRKLKEAAEATGEPPPPEMDMDDATYLAGKNYIAIGKVVVAARAAMDWLQAAARVAAKDELPIRWVTPAGLPVLQEYRVEFGKRFDFDIAGSRYRMLLRIEGERLDKRKQGAGISPNFVHSLDAAHMIRTVSYCLEAGVTSFAMVHDSFGSHAADADVLAYQLRRAFVDQYSVDVLAEFRDQLIEQLPEHLASEVPPLPPHGTLDLSGVMDSAYFFA